jgi:hypothetical protein
LERKKKGRKSETCYKDPIQGPADKKRSSGNLSNLSAKAEAWKLTAAAARPTGHSDFCQNT